MLVNVSVDRTKPNKNHLKDATRALRLALDCRLWHIGTGDRQPATFACVTRMIDKSYKKLGYFFK